MSDKLKEAGQKLVVASEKFRQARVEFERCLEEYGALIPDDKLPWWRTFLPWYFRDE